MSEFDDPELRNRLGGLSGAFPDENRALATVHRSVTRARRRRAAAWTSGTAAVGLLVVGAYAAGVRQSNDTLRPGTPDTSIGGRVTTTSTETQPTSTTLVETSTPTSTPSDSKPPTPTTGPTGIAPTATATTSGNTTGTTNTTGTSTATQPPTSVGTGSTTSTYEGLGGSIQVRLQNGTMTVLAMNAAAGYEAQDILEEPTRVEVRFRSATHSTRIRIDVVNGSMAPDIEEETD